MISVNNFLMLLNLRFFFFFFLSEVILCKDEAFRLNDYPKI